LPEDTELLFGADYREYDEGSSDPGEPGCGLPCAVDPVT